MILIDREKEFEIIWEKVKTFIPSHSSILVTGGNGLIASNFVDLLMHFNEYHGTNNKLIVLCRNEEKAKKRFQKFVDSEQFHLEIQDIQTFTMEQKCEYIIHAASNAHPKAYSLNPIDTMKTTLLGTMNVLQYAVEKNVNKIVYVSSSEIYGEAPFKSNKFVETDFGSINTLASRSCYSESKRCAETLCACYVKEKGLDISIVRPGYIYGAQITEDNSRADAQFLRKVAAKENIIMKSKGEQIRSYCYVMDAASALIYVMVKGQQGMAYNIANSNSEASIRKFAETMAELGGVDIVFDIPSRDEKQGYSVIRNSLLDDSKLRGLGWEPEYDLKQGLMSTISQIIGK